MSQTPYEEEILSWRQMMDERLRADDGWLTLTGLFWLDEGENVVGSDPASDVILPNSAPDCVGVINFSDGTATLVVNNRFPTTVDGQSVSSSVLLDDHNARGASRVDVGSVSFHVIKRGDQYGVRVRDRENPARKDFKGRIWFPVDPAYRIVARFVTHPSARMMEIENMLGGTTLMQNPGYAEFELGGSMIRLEAFSSRDDEVWFVFRDATSSTETYGAGRFLYAPIQPDGTAVLDFNKAYNPPCAFTVYSTCPLPPKENILSIRIEAGEMLLPEQPTPSGVEHDR